MTIQEASERYCIPVYILKEYEKMNLCGMVKKVIGNWHYDDTDIEHLSMIMTLHDIGFSNEDIDIYMRMLISGESKQNCLDMLNEKRANTLDKIHLYEKKLERLDYLRYSMKNNK